jgi:hypothetical protein
MRYFLRCTDGRGETWFHGQSLYDGGLQVKGLPLALPESQARWLGPRLAKHLRGYVEALAPDAADEEGRRYNTLGCWRYNQESGEVETTKEWGDTHEGYTHATGGGSECDGVSSIPQESGRP